MKNFAKIFTAIVVAFAAYSCAADATEDLGVQLGGGEGQTTITLSLEESKTQLGEKVGDVYPLYWSEGDAIAVNGEVSTPLTAEGAGKPEASFNFAEGVIYPYHIVYPAPAEGVVAVAEGCYPVVFPAVQQYVAGNIDGKSAPMYGYAAEGEVPTMQHLVGLLQFNVKGNGEVLKTLTVESEKGAIAGTFDVNCSTGALTAQAESTSNTVTMSFGEGLTLGADVATFYVAVPAGSYGVFTATLATDTEAMVVKFNSDVKPIAVGNVREFTEFTFVNNIGDSEGDFIIDSEEKLIQFAQNAETTSANVVVTKSLDMSGYDWTPIEGFGSFTFDGGSEQGYTIKGLKAPLFGTTCAKIKNVTLEGVALTSNGQLIMGAIVNTLTSAGQSEKASLTNCKAIGTLTVSNTEWTPASGNASDKTIVNYGGLVGRVYGADIIGCTNQVAVTVEQIAVKGNTITIFPCVAGVVGYVEDAILADGNGVSTALTSVTNDAAVSYDCTANKDDNNWVARVFVGGVIGSNNSGEGFRSTPTLNKCYNTEKGTVAINSNVGGTYNWGGGSCIGGIAGYIYTGRFEDCDNEGAILADGRLYNISIGGVAGIGYYCYVSNCDNYGAVSVSKESTILATIAGGVMGSCYGNTSDTMGMHDCTNNAPVTIAASTDKGYSANSSRQWFYRIGGVVGFLRVNSSGLTNNKEGAVTTSGDIVIYTSNTELIPLISGCIAYKTTGSSSGNYKNYAPVTVSNNFSYTENAAIDKHPVSISGVISGGGTNYLENAINEGDVTFNGTITGGAAAYIGGVLANAVSNDGVGVTSGTNSGKVSVIRPNGVTEDAGINCPTYIGGVVAASTKEKTGTYTNSGEIIIEKDFADKCYVGGVAGDVKLITPNAKNTKGVTINSNSSFGNDLYVGGVIGRHSTTSEITGLSNSGSVTVDCAVTGNLYIGGVLGHSSAIATSAANSGAVTVGNAKATENITIGGVLKTGGVYGYYNGSGALNGVQNTGNVSVYGNITGNTSIGGVGVSVSNVAVTNVTNVGNIVAAGNYNAALYVGGVLAELLANDKSSEIDLTTVTNGALGDDNTPADNKGEITIAGTVTGMCWVSGILAGAGYNYRPGNVSETHNYGDINLSGTFNGKTYINGISSGCPYNGKTVTNVSNQGDITMSGNSNALFYVTGGFSYTTDKSVTYTNLYNTGDIIVTETAKMKDTGDRVCLVGVAGYRISAATYDGCYNSGDILFKGTYSGSKSLYMGGFAGDQLKTVIIKNDLTNSGDIEFSGTFESSGTLYINGLGLINNGATGVSLPDFTNAGTIKNTGKIAFTGTQTSSSNINVGGLFSYVEAGITSISSSDNNVSFVNVGNIEVTGTAGTPANVYVGGIVGNLLSPIAGATVDCDIKAVGYNAGMITGSAKSETVVAENCQLRGTICKEIVNSKDPDENDIQVEKIVVLNNETSIMDNDAQQWVDYYYSYIYGSNNPESAADANDCSYLETPLRAQ